MPAAPPLILASASPSRLRLLLAAGIVPVVEVSNQPEEGVDPSAPTAMVATLARRKAEAVAARHTEGLVLGCDSALELDGVAVGKPLDPETAVTRWQHMRGRTGVLHTGHCLIDARRRSSAAGVESTLVRFGRPDDSQIEAYVATGEPLDVAGAFTLDGRSGPFVEGVEGDPSNVIGLSLPLLRRLLAELDTDIVDLWAPP